MNFTLIKIGASDDEDFKGNRRDYDSHQAHYMRSDAFKVLPPLSPQIPGPPRTPEPYRILPPIVSRKRPSFVIIQEVGDKPLSREPSPSGRVSPFRGCGFRSSREPSPSRKEHQEKHQSRSRLPVAQHCSRKVSKSVSPVGTKTSGIPRPLNRRISYSPNRAKEILQELEAKTKPLVKPPLKSSENLYRTNTRQQKPPLPQKPRPKNLNLQKSPDRKPISVTSPIKAKPPKPEQKKVASPAKKPIAALRNYSRSPEKTGSPLVRSKENLTPSKTPSPVKSPSKTFRPIPKTPVKTNKNEKNKNSLANNETKSPEKTQSPGVAQAKEEKKYENESKVLNEQVTEKKLLKGIIKKKAQTTNILLNATRRTKKESNVQDKEKNVENHSPLDQPSEEEKKDLPHTDTSRSLPISVGSSNMTDSSATLIRTTTEPALAPVEPDLITEIRSAMNEIKNAEEEICVKQEKKDLSSDVDPTTRQVGGKTTQAENSKTDVNKSITEKIEESLVSSDSLKDSLIRELDGKNPFMKNFEVKDSPKLIREVNVKNSPKLSKEFGVKNSPKLTKVADIRNSPLPVHVVAVTKIDEPKQEITAIGNIKQGPDNEVSDASDTIKRDNRNGMSKSSWLQKKSKIENMKKPMLQKSVLDHPSQENLLDIVKPSSRWKRLKAKCPKCFKKSEKPVQISTITKSAATAQNVPKKSCFKKYFCCFCYKCRLKRSKKLDKSLHTQQPQRAKGTSKRFPIRCINCKNSFKSIFHKISCKKNSKKVKLPKSEKMSQKSDSGVACVNVPQKRSYCGKCKSGMYRCFGIICCLNTAFCLKLNSCCKKVCCCRCSCCGRRKKTNISEPPRRKSTISTPKRKRWTRMFTDFPKLDAGFVEHASIMRGSIPVLPVPLAWICLILNVFLPGFGTLSSGIFCLFVGKPRFSINDSIVSRIGAFLVNLLVAGSQLFTVLFCLVGWGWSIWWGVMMLKMARKNKRIMLAEQSVHMTHVTPATEDPNRDTEKGLSNG